MINQDLKIENLSRAFELNQTVQNNNGQLNNRFETKLQQEMNLNGLESSAHSEGNFIDFINNSIEKVNLDQHQANHAIKELIAGKNKNIHETMLAIEKAEISLKLMTQVRNKIVEAYREIMRMQV